MRTLNGLALSVTLLLAGCSKSDVTGSYVFTDATTIDYITLVQRQDGHLEGRQIFSSTTWSGVSGFSQVEWQLSGTIEGKVLTLAVTSPQSPEPTPMAGVVDVHSLVLTTRGVNPMRFVSITPDRYTELRRALMAGEKLESTKR